MRFLPFYYRKTLKNGRETKKKQTKQIERGHRKETRKNEFPEFICLGFVDGELHRGGPCHYESNIDHLPVETPRVFIEDIEKMR